MQYIKERALYYTLFISELTGDAPSKVFVALAPIFLLKKTDAAMLGLLSDETLCALSSAASIEIYRNYIRAFCGNKNAFGRLPDEQRALEIKSGVIKAASEFDTAFATNRLMVLAENYDRLKLGVVYALALFYCNREAGRTVTQLLQRAAADADGIDACVALMYLEKNTAGERFAYLKANPAFEMYPDLNKALAKRYGLKDAPSTKGLWEVYHG
ncbi:MAG: hypothetical protein HDT28_08165 [Clostridiales bacterium]|nr:hypothetical protein [Clostridiales bacterium]